MAGSVGDWSFCWWWTMWDFEKSPCTKPSVDALMTPDSWYDIPDDSNNKFIDVHKTLSESNDTKHHNYIFSMI